MLSSKKEDEWEETVTASASTLDKHFSVSYCSHLHVQYIPFLWAMQMEELGLVGLFTICR